MSFFHFRTREATVGREVVAGATTFLTMAYIVFVNPDILSKTGMDKDALITATILATVVGTLLCGLWARVPLAMAPGMGLNAMFTYSLVMGHGLTWQTALGAVFVSGLLFLVLTVCNVRQQIVNAIPEELRLAVPAGIGLFIAFIGLKAMGVVVDAPDERLVQLGAFDRSTLFAVAGLVVMVVLSVLKTPGSILIGIGVATVLGWTLGGVAIPERIVSLPASPLPVMFKLDVLGALRLGLIGALFSLMFVDMFDSIGTILACAYEADMVDEKGQVKFLNPMLQADATATMLGAVIGTSTTTTYIESGTGIAAGGRTGLTAVVTALLFVGMLFLTPLIGAVPSYATGPALVIVGALMFKHMTDVELTDFKRAFPAYVTMLMMPLTHSISTGMAFGFLSYVLIQVASGEWRRIQPFMWAIAVLSLVDLVVNAV